MPKEKEKETKKINISEGILVISPEEASVVKDGEVKETYKGVKAFDTCVRRYKLFLKE